MVQEWSRNGLGMRLYEWSKDETVRTELYITCNTFHWMKLCIGECSLSGTTGCSESTESSGSRQLQKTAIAVYDRRMQENAV